MIGILGKNTKLGLLLNILIILILTAGIVGGFFYWYLPKATNSGQSITVPDVTGNPVEKAMEDLSGKDLGYFIADSTYSSEFPPLTVLAQHPAPNEKVKINRKIYLTVNKVNAPKTKIPDIIDGTVKSAARILKSADLELGKIEYIPDKYVNTVLKVEVNGEILSKKELQEGYMVEQGTKIKIYAGNGLGRDELSIPEVVGMPLDEVELFLLGIGLKVGQIEYIDTVGVEIGQIIRQSPEPERGTVIKKGALMDLWVSGYYPENVIGEEAEEGTLEEGKEDK
ncbi:PASTA domain-containing protein [Flexithrix dorotheae]|uniref:PASTA domain-containing protein n=1 Tax=Flexithrix dorotheae TaxID=70993 RepID=UPI0003610DA7|nr:PASTA domain-containing protein [Flexithrix dorotheae]